MLITGVTVDDFEAIVDTVSGLYDGNLQLHQDAHAVSTSGRRIRARVTVAASRGDGARRSWSGRRMRAACWHAYRDVLAELFRLYPDAVVRTGMAVYRGAEGFEREYPATAYANVGSMMAPAYMPELCDCDDTGPRLTVAARMTAARVAPYRAATDADVPREQRGEIDDAWSLADADAWAAKLAEAQDARV